MQEGRVALLPELLVLLALRASHPLHHFFTQLHWRRQWFGVSAQDVAKVDVKQLSWREDQTLKTLNRETRILDNPKKRTRFLPTCLCQQQVVQMSVSHSEDVGDDTVTG